MKMSEPPYNRLQEDQTRQGAPSGEGFPAQQAYQPQYGYPLQDTNQQIGVPTSSVITRDVQVQPNDYLGLSIFVLICCCLPLGIVAVIKANEVSSRFRLGDYDGAEESSRQAKTWAMGGLIYGVVSWSIGVVVGIVYMILVVVVVNESVQENSYY